MKQKRELIDLVLIVFGVICIFIVIFIAMVFFNEGIVGSEDNEYTKYTLNKSHTEQIKEKAYFEGQKDYVNGIIRIKKSVGGKYHLIEKE